jgi:hypothetical protein
MTEYPQLSELLEAIDNDWAICDDNDDHDYMTLVNEDREEHPALRSPKSHFADLEAQRLVIFDEELSHPKNASREYMDFLGERVPEPFVYFYTLTDRGRDYLRQQR